MAAGDGLVTMTPTSIAVAGAGSSASINSDGGVDFTSATSLSLNGVFTSSFDNYCAVLRCTASAIWNNMQFKLRVAGTDTTGSDYTWQYLEVFSTTRNGGRLTSQTSMSLAGADSSLMNGAQIYFYGPALAQPTAARGVTVASYDNAAFSDVAATHSLSTAYDGFSFSMQSGSVTGSITVFGYEE